MSMKRIYRLATRLVEPIFREVRETPGLEIALAFLPLAVSIGALALYVHKPWAPSQEALATIFALLIAAVCVSVLLFLAAAAGWFWWKWRPKRRKAAP